MLDGLGIGAPPPSETHGEHAMQWIRSRMDPRDDAGQGLAEYALILALIAIVAIVALIFLGEQISSIVNDVGESI
jgi:Flp pilus assembly pilin Flp